MIGSPEPGRKHEQKFAEVLQQVSFGQELELQKLKGPLVVVPRSLPLSNQKHWLGQKFVLSLLLEA